jgi:lipid-binding SYLF domain-containing protein
MVPAGFEIVAPDVLCQFSAMRTLFFATVLLGLASTTFADSKNELDDQVRKLMAQFDSLQANAHARVPAGKLKKAQGIVVLDRRMGGLVFGYEKGSGVAMVKHHGKWGPFSFMTSHESSFGVQIGGKATFCVILLMNQSACHRLLESKVDYTGEAVGTGGSHTHGRKKRFTKEPGTLVYAESQGIYGGAVIKGAELAPDDKANQAYYGRFCSIKDILFDKKVEPSETAREFAQKLEEAAEAK